MFKELKFDKVNAALMGAYIAADLVEMGMKKRHEARRQAAIDAVNAKHDARETELRHRLKLLEEMAEECRRDGHGPIEVTQDDLDFMDKA